MGVRFYPDATLLARPAVLAGCGAPDRAKDGSGDTATDTRPGCSDVALPNGSGPSACGDRPAWYFDDPDHPTRFIIGGAVDDEVAIEFGRRTITIGPTMRSRILFILLLLAAPHVSLVGCDTGGADAGTTDTDAGTDVGDDAAQPLAAVPPEYGEHDPHPEPPAILRDVSMVDDDARFTHPYVPGHRTTMDGRLAIRVQGGPPGTDRINHNLSFFLLVPERLDEPVMAGPAGARILGDPEPFDVEFPPSYGADVERLGHHTICDPTQEFAVEGERPNPYPCDSDPTHDCYDITVISSTSPGVGAQLWGTPVTVQVSDPKTADAAIVSVELGEPVAGFEIPLTGEWTEPAVTIDGRLLTGRWGRAPRQWTNPETGDTLTRNWDLAYSVLPEGAEPCDVTGWTDFHPMSHAPYDPAMVGRYGLAAYPFRDSEGNPIEDGEDLGGTYPWVDREGANVFMAAVPGRIVEQSPERYPRRCVTPGCGDYEENNDWDRGFMVGGLWTHGKFVHLDAMINNMDWAVGVTPEAHFFVDLYRDAEGGDVAVRFGAGRYIDRIRDAGGPYPDGYTHNANILDSLQNLPNHHTYARTVTPRDVVWLMSTGVSTDEVAFDDFLDIDALIVSNMQGSITPLRDDEGATLGLPYYWNGQVRELMLPIAVAQFYVLEPDLDDEIHLQNAATSLRWNLPPYGLVAAGAGRVEPVALGGITGKGFWLSGDAAITYAIPAQQRGIRDADWYFGAFLDPRSDEERVVATFPDGSAVHVAGRTTVRYVDDGIVLHEVPLPGNGEGWFHLGLALRDGNHEIELLVDGFPLDRFAVEEPLFELTEGDLVVGQPADDSGFEGFRGWIDELLVLAHVPNAEVACNHAHGTLIDVGSSEPWTRVASAYPEWAHNGVAEAAGLEGGEYACFHDYTADYQAHLGNIPEGAVSVREAINFPEGPLLAGVPRPDSASNAFCLTCHHDEGLGGLSLAALELDADVPAELDRRRQPLQPPRRVFGNVPADWIPAGAGPGSPDAPVTAPAGGFLIDGWVLPAAE